MGDHSTPPLAPGSMRAPAAVGRVHMSSCGTIAYTLIETAKLNGVDPQAWLTHILERIADQKITKHDGLMPWRYAAQTA